MKIFKRKKAETVEGRNPRDYQGKTAPVFSYHSNRSSDLDVQTRNNKNDVQARQRKHPVWVGYFPSIVSLLIVIAAVCYLTTLAASPRVAISTNPNQPAVLQPTQVYEQATAELIKDSIFNRSKITIDTDKIAETLEADFPELGEIIIAIPLIGRRPLVQTNPASPALILVGKGGSFMIDNRGIPVLKANQLASSIKNVLPVVTDSSDTEIKLGEQILTTDKVDFMQTVHTQLKSKKLVVESYTLPAQANELHVRLAGKGYFIKFNTEADARTQLGTYLAVQERLDSEGKSPNEYIDVRVEERAYVK